VGRLDVVAVGDVEESLMEIMERRAAESLGLEPRRRPALPVPGGAWDPERRQYESSTVLRSVVQAPAGPDPTRVLAVTEIDLFIPMLTFVFGQAQLEGPVALVSLARLRQEFYGLPPDPAVLRARAVKEALHEMGHTFGLSHCPDGRCAMALSHNVRQIDTKGSDYCDGCRVLIEERRAARPGGGAGSREDFR